MTLNLNSLSKKVRQMDFLKVLPISNNSDTLLGAIPQINLDIFF